MGVLHRFQPYGPPGPRVGWMIKLKATKPDEFGKLLDAKAYEKHCAH